MIFKKSQKLETWQSKYPIVYHQYLDDTELINFDKNDLLNFLNAKGTQIKTWGREPKKKEFDPHFIATKGSTGLHTDPGYPRYTHQIKLFVDEGIYTKGIAEQKMNLKRGLFYILDTHSPHEVISEQNKFGLNVSLSIDSYSLIEPEDAIKILLMYNNYKKSNANLFE